MSINVNVNDEPWYAPQNNGYHGSHVFGTTVPVLVRLAEKTEKGVTSMVPLVVNGDCALFIFLLTDGWTDDDRNINSQP
jgi:hypothetical protein